MPVQTGIKESKLLRSQRKRENQLIVVAKSPLTTGESVTKPVMVLLFG